MKDDVYLYFRNKCTGMYKEHRSVQQREEFDIYWYKIFKDGNEITFAYTPVRLNKIIYQDSNFVKAQCKSIETLSKIDAFGYDTTDQKRFPFKRIFIVEYLEPNRYQVLQVTSYIGSDY